VPCGGDHAHRHLLVFADKTVMIRVRIEIELASYRQRLAHQCPGQARIESQCLVVQLSGFGQSSQGIRIGGLYSFCA
jgi:hypothetical protein